MKDIIKRLLREGLTGNDNFGYRAGDITSRKPEQRNKFSNGGRDTGHFGTGYYFMGTLDKAKKYAKGESRVITKIPLDGYKLAKGTLELHEILKDINNYDLGASKDDDKLKNSLISLLNYFNLMEKADCSEWLNYEPKYPIRNNRDYENATEEYLEKADEETAYIDTLRRKCGQEKKRVMEPVDKLIKLLDDNKTSEDSPSTLVMKALGYDGVDSRNTELDNGVYGSVIYDI